MKSLSDNVSTIQNKYLKGSIAWYPFVCGRSALVITGFKSEFAVLRDYLIWAGLSVTCVNIDEVDAFVGEGVRYDYIISALAMESAQSLTTCVNQLLGSLNDGGKLLALADNRLAIRYFTGDKDLFTGHVLDGIDNYRGTNIERVPGRGYSKAEWEQALSENGLKYKFYGVFPSLFNANMFIADGYVPNENMIERFQAYYNNPGTVYADERYMYKTLQDNKMLTVMANGFFIECSLRDDMTDYNQVTVQSNRDDESALVTVLRNDEVIKRPMWSTKTECLVRLSDNNEYLSAHGIPVAQAHMDNDAYVTKYIDGPIATEYFQNLLADNLDKFFEEFEEYIELLTRSSEHVTYDEVEWDKFDPRWETRKKDDPKLNYWRDLSRGSDEERAHIGPILKKGFIDLTTINSVRSKDGFIFFDQEFYVTNLPAKALILRAIDFIYTNPRMNQFFPREKMLERYDLFDDLETWRDACHIPLEKLLHVKEQSVDRSRHGLDYKKMIANRMRMDYSDEEYERYFVDIFKGIYDRKCYIFGSGKFAEKFLELYGNNLEVAGILDNNAERHGETINGITIMSPEVLIEETVAYKVIVCIKYYDEVIAQLKGLGASHISIYDPRKSYELPRRVRQVVTDTKKKYHIGYVAGVFDVFHRGHVNILRRAKEQCDHLIVGVVSDEQVMRAKKTMPHFSFEERLEIVRACRYVDEAYMIPIERAGTEDAYEMYRFDAQFSGSDYEDDPYWLAAREYLREHGSELVFFPYTEGVSSTMVKAKLKEQV